MVGIRIASATSSTRGTLARMSSGVSSRLALYSVYSSWRNVGPGGSNTTARWVGFSFFRTSSTVVVKPKTALVFWPLLLIRGFRMKA